MFRNYDGVSRDGEVGNKKQHYPRSWQQGDMAEGHKAQDLRSADGPWAAGS
jgi:hypothetical protein